MKKALSVLLAFLMAMSAVSVGAFAEDAEPTAAVHYNMVNGGLYSIDFSDMIRDTATINTGILELWSFDYLGTEDEFSWVWMNAKFDAEKPGVAVIGYADESGAFVQNSILCLNTNVTMELRAANGKLFDDVESFRFTFRDVLNDTDSDQKIGLNDPNIRVTEKDGEIVKKMELDFNEPWAGKDSVLLDTADLTKEIAITIHLFTAEVNCVAKPLRYADGVLTVSVQKDGKEGVLMHDIVSYVGDELTNSTYWLSFAIPEDMFTYGEHISNAASTIQWRGVWIENFPTRTGLNVKIPAWITRIGNSIFGRLPDNRITSMLAVMFALPMFLILCPFPVTRLMRVFKKSFDAYGLDFYKVASDGFRSGELIDLLRNMLSGSLF